MAGHSEALIDSSIKDPHFMADPKVVDGLWKEFTTLGSNDSITNQMLVMELYERAFDIQTPTSTSPVTLVTKKISTNCYIDTLYERTVDRILELKMSKNTGMSLTEILELPTFKLMCLVRSITRIGRKEGKILDEIEETLQ